MIAKIIMITGGFILVVAGITLYHYSRSKKADALLVRKEAEFKKWQKKVAEVEKLDAQIREVENYLSAINQISKNKFLYVQLLQDILEDLPPTMWFTSINTNNQGSKTNIDFQVKSRSALDLAYWINYLEKDKKYSDIEVGSISMAEKEGQTTYTTFIKVAYSR